MTHAENMGAPHELERCPIMPNYGPPPVMFVRGEGTELWDREGRRYLDFLGGLAVNSLGHSNPVVADAIAEQARTLQHVSNLFGTEPQLEVARTLDRLILSGVDTTPNGSGQVFFANSGAEANEAAIKLARKFHGRGRHTVVSAFRSFHGRTLATLHATGQPEKHEPFQPLPEGFKHVPFAEIDELDRIVDDSVAAVLLEPLQGEGGVNPADPEYFQAVRRLCDERGALLILDEVQTGLGRTGRWFGFQHFDIVPDIVTVAKALGNGMPIGACWARADVASAFRPGDHGSTFGGQPLAAAAARAVLSEMERLDAPGLAREKGAALQAGLAAIDGVTSVRGLGMLVAAEIDPEFLARRTGGEVAAQCLAAGVVVNAITPTALRMAPPLTISDAQLVEGLAAVAEVIGSGSR